MGAMMTTMNATTAPETNQLKPKSLSQILDYISTYYILTMDFTSLRKLYDKKYCDDLVILTSDIIERYFTSIEITYLAQRLEKGIQMDLMEKDNMVFFNKDELKNMDIQNAIKKKRVCNSIAKFYIKIAHIFAAIVTTINPVYVYKDEDGNTVRANLKEKANIPKNVPRNIYKLNMCDNRVNTLINDEDYSKFSSNNVDDEINIHPKVCSANINDIGDAKTLAEEPGIPELMELYLDDKYDYETGKFTGMLPQTQQIFQENLKNFYNKFTGNNKNNPVPPEITKFSDIKLKNYHNMPECNGPDPVLRRTVKGTLANSLFAMYADNLKKMMSNANNNQSKLLNILNKIFVYVIDPQTKKKKIRINPTLTETQLQLIVIETRAIIIELYLQCETDYANGIKIYETIVDNQILESSKNQMKTLHQMSDTLLSEEPINPPAELEIIKNMQQNNIAVQIKEELKI